MTLTHPEPGPPPHRPAVGGGPTAARVRGERHVHGVGIAAGAVVIGAVSVIMSLGGLELGGLPGRWVGRRGEQASGMVLILVGAAIAGGPFG